MSQQFFKGIKSQEEGKELFRKLCKKYHPDKVGGSEEEFKELYRQYVEFQQQFQKEASQNKEPPSMEEFLISLQEQYLEEYNLTKSVLRLIFKYKK